LIGSAGSHQIFPSPVFLQPDPFQPWICQVSGRPAGPDRILKLWFELFFLQLTWLFFPLVFSLKKTTHTLKNVSVLHHLISTYPFLMATFYIIYITTMLVYIYTQFLNPAWSKARVPGFDRVTRSAGSISILKKIQNDVVLVKKTKVNELQPGFWPGFAGSTGSWLFLFFSTRPGSSPGSTRRAGPGFKTMVLHYPFLLHY